jgi:hypothetical protein
MGRVGIEPTTLGLKETILAPVRRSFPRKINELRHRSARGRWLALVGVGTSFGTWTLG